MNWLKKLWELIWGKEDLPSPEPAYTDFGKPYEEHTDDLINPRLTAVPPMYDNREFHKHMIGYLDGQQ